LSKNGKFLSLSVESCLRILSLSVESCLRILSLTQGIGVSVNTLWLRKDLVSENLIFDNAAIIYVIMVITARGKAI
jgi:hypothetical protein